jgi:hypothetical protein
VLKMESCKTCIKFEKYCNRYQNVVRRLERDQHVTKVKIVGIFSVFFESKIGV